MNARTTHGTILEAARVCLLDSGYAGLSTRKVADEAGVPLSQIHYHFKSKQGLILALLETENQRRLARQTVMYAQNAPLWKRYEQACDFLEDDLSSGYVRVLQEMIAAGWSDGEVAEAVRRLLGGWYELLAQVCEETEDRLDGLDGFEAGELAALIGNVFIGSEALLLLGFTEQQIPIRSALRKISAAIRVLEEEDER